jgi:hypothetical protein
MRTVIFGDARGDAVDMPRDGCRNLRARRRSCAVTWEPVSNEEAVKEAL